jgi:cytochrome c oxidase cbb3-type subunit 3
MRVESAWVAAAAIGVALSVSVRATEGPHQAPAQPPVIEGHGGPPPAGAPAPQAPATTPAPRPAGGPGGPGGPGGGQGRFPAQQRPKGNPDVIQRGRGIFAGACGPCHGADARGGQLGGPNLLRSELALNDKAGELLYPVIKNGRPGTQMVASPLPDEDIRAVIAFVHDLQSKIGGQGNPPPGEEVKLDILVGDAKAGAAYFTAKCASCHSATGDLAGLATRYADPKQLQNVWVSGGRAIARGGGVMRPAGGTPRAFTTATVTLPSGEKAAGRLLRIDDFSVTIAQADGSPRTYRRNGDTPKVEIADPLEGHIALLRVLTDADMHNVTAYLVTLK